MGNFVSTLFNSLYFWRLRGGIHIKLSLLKKATFYTQSKWSVCDLSVIVSIAKWNCINICHLKNRNKLTLNIRASINKKASFEKSLKCFIKRSMWSSEPSAHSEGSEPRGVEVGRGIESRRVVGCSRSEGCWGVSGDLWGWGWYVPRAKSLLEGEGLDRVEIFQGFAGNPTAVIGPAGWGSLLQSQRED